MNIFSREKSLLGFFLGSFSRNFFGFFLNFFLSFFVFLDSRESFRLSLSRFFSHSDNGVFALLAFDNRVRNNGSDELNGFDSVVVSGDNVIDKVRVAVGIGDSYYRDIELLSFLNRDFLARTGLLRHNVGQSSHFSYTAKVKN